MRERFSGSSVCWKGLKVGFLPTGLCPRSLTVTECSTSKPRSQAQDSDFLQTLYSKNNIEPAPLEFSETIQQEWKWTGALCFSAPGELWSSLWCLLPPTPAPGGLRRGSSASSTTTWDLSPSSTSSSSSSVCLETCCLCGPSSAVPEPR